MVKRSQRLVALFAAVIILFEVAAVPQKAKAVAISASVIASVAVIMTACGISYWAASQTDVVDYLGGKIDAYLGSLETVPVSYEDWLGINAPSELFEVVSGGVMRFGSGIANKVLDFVRWFNMEEGIASGGDPVSDAVGGMGFSPIYFPSNTVHSGDVSSTWAGTNLLRIDFANYSGSGGYLRFEGVVDQPGTYGFTVRQVSGVTTASFERVWLNLLRSNGYGQATSSCVFGPGYSASTGQVYQWQIEDYGPSFTFAIGFSLAESMTSATGFCVLELTGKDWYKAATNSFVPSATVSVPEDVAEDQSLDVAPNVPLAQGMSVEDASDALYDGITSEDGLTSTAESVESPSFDLSGILEALGSILNAILSIPSHIANGVQSIVVTLGQKVDAFKDAVHGFLTAFDSYLYDIRQRVIEMAHDITMDISDRLEYLFVPDEVYVQNYVQSIMHLFDGRVGILTFPLSVFVDFLTRFSSISDGDHSFHWGNINEPFSGKQVIAAGSYNLDDAVASSPMSTVYSVYLVVVKAVIAFWFLRLCQRKYELIVNGH